MTAVMPPPQGAHFVLPSPAPRQGILLNRSPSSSAPNSPKKHPAHLIQRPSSGGTHPPTHSHTLPLLHPLPSSQSSASSATSSTDDLNSSTSATSANDVLSPIPSSSKGPCSKTAPSSRRIRFAPLPTTDRDYVYTDDPISPGFYADVDSTQSSPHAPVIGLLPPSCPQVTSPTSTGQSSSGGALAHPHSHAHASSSTLGLSLNDSSEHVDSGVSTETNTILGSECSTDDTHHTATGRQRLKWARLLRLPKASNGSFRSPGPDPSSSSAVNLSRCNSRESTVSLGSMRGGFFGWASLSDNGSSTSLGALSRRKTNGASESLPASPAIRGTLPLKPVTSERGTSSTTAPRTKPRTGSNASTTSAQAGPVRRGTRLLNGRIYGAKRQQQGFQQKNPFANVHDDTEFVEWGHGGMGSTKSVGGKTNYAALQSSNKLSIGHVEGGRAAVDDDDDGSGMGWVKRRREQREREKKEKEDKERLEAESGETKTNDDEDPSPSHTDTADAVGASAPAEETKKEVITDSPVNVVVSIPVDASSVPSTPQPQSRGRISAEERRDKDKEYVYTAVTVPAPRPHHHHSHSQSHLHSPSLTPTREFSSSPLASATAGVVGVGPGPSPLGLTGMTTAASAGPSEAAGVGSVDADAEAASPSEGSSPPQSSASSSFDDEGEEDADADSGEKDEDADGDERDEEEEDEMVMRMRARTQANAAGVEKISRHKPEHAN